MKNTFFTLILIAFTFTIQGQIQTGVWRSTNANKDYHHFIRDGGGAAVYINQISTEPNIPILRLSSGSGGANQNVKFTVENNGNVGIGTLTPSTKLAVEGITQSTTFRSSATNTSYHHFIRDGGGAAVYVNQNSTDPNTPILRLSSGATGANQNVKFTVENNGSVGIGTTNTGSWKLAVNGNIRAKEINVQTGWADFVFDDEYKLPSLEEVENHILHNKHLKDIPTAKEVKENGILLGEINAKLLQKIEELTLYTIQQQKEINRLQLIEKRLNKIESQLKQQQ